jgi:hypothetical protein
MTSTHAAMRAAHADHSESHPQPEKWWEWALLYPTLVVLILSSIPACMEFAGSSSLAVPVHLQLTGLL